MLTDVSVKHFSKTLDAFKSSTKLSIIKTQLTQLVGMELQQHNVHFHTLTWTSTLITLTSCTYLY